MALDLSDGCGRFDDGFTPPTESKPITGPGWFCCQCRVFNGFQRVRCKRCSHESCFATSSEDVFIIHRTGGESVYVDTIHQSEREKLRGS